MAEGASEDRLRPFIKWPGGKESELPTIMRNMPTEIGRYFEPFVGGGAVCLALGHDKSYVNDKSPDLVSLWRAVADDPSGLAGRLRAIHAVFSSMEGAVVGNAARLESMRSAVAAGRDIEATAAALVDAHLKGLGPSVPACLLSEGHLREELIRCLVSKVKRMRKLEASRGSLCPQDRLDNYECGLKGGVYMAARRVYNAGVGGSVGAMDRVAAFYFLREYCYSSMFRYNRNGDFNVPYGGISYNRKDFESKVAYLASDRLSSFVSGLTICEGDFAEFLETHEPEAGDLLFVDPPYDSEFSTYDRSSFGRDDQTRLADLLASTEANVMAVIKRTDFIYDLYESRGFSIASFDKTYQVSFKARNARGVTHLLITNYPIGDGEA